jgi:hypothetical protein
MLTKAFKLCAANACVHFCSLSHAKVSVSRGGASPSGVRSASRNPPRESISVSFSRSIPVSVYTSARDLCELS